MDIQLSEGHNLTIKLSMKHGYCEDCGSLSYNTAGTADAGGDVTHTVDAERTEAEDFWNGCYIYYCSGDNIGLTRLVTDFVAATDTLTHAAFPNAVAAGDEYVLTDWKQTADGQTATLEVLYNDIFHINVTNSAGNKTIYWEKDISNISTTTNTKMVIRYMTSSSSIKAKVELIFTAGTQTILAEDDSTFWTYVKATPTTGKTLDKIRFYANQATGSVYYDLFLIYSDDFEFPHVSDTVALQMPNNYVDIRGLGRAGNITQYLGRDSMPIFITGVMDDHADWDDPQGNSLLQLWNNAAYDPFQWLESDNYIGKVTLRNFKLDEPSRDREYPRGYTLELKEYARSNLGEATWLYGWKGIL